jgi:hypothetical protein
MERVQVAIFAKTGPNGMYHVDTDGNVYSKLTTQGTSQNPRYHLWDGKEISRIYKCDLRDEFLRMAKAKMLFSVTD